MDQREALARRLRIERAARGLSLTEAAEKIGIQRDTLSALEKGRRGVYSGTLERIATAYDLTLAELLGEETTVAGPKVSAPTPSSGRSEREYMRQLRGDPREIDLEETMAEARRAMNDTTRRLLRALDAQAIALMESDSEEDHRALWDTLGLLEAEAQRIRDKERERARESEARKGAEH